MSYLWSFQSVTEQGVSSVFGSKNAEIKNKIVDALTWDEIMSESEAQKIAEHFTSKKLDEIDGSILDAEDLAELMQVMVSPEGLEEELGVEYESPDGIHTNTFKELAEKGLKGKEDLVITRFFEPGFVLLACDEQLKLKNEIEEAISTQTDWSNLIHPDLIKEDLIDVLATIHSKGKLALATIS